MNVYLWPAKNRCCNIAENEDKKIFIWLNASHYMQVRDTNAGLCETKVDPWLDALLKKKIPEKEWDNFNLKFKHFWEKKFNDDDRNVRFFFPNLAHDCISVSREWHILAAVYHEDFLFVFCKVVYKMMISLLFTITTFWIVLQNQEW